ncbi:MAG: Holliday junction resolvase RuvX [Clostridiaceae bacterium]|nr:Holliday junction resolvase RuvX [Clostridiaceae bacterium]
MRIMGIDYGDARIGIAISDPFGWTAQPVETIKWKNNIIYPVERIRNLVEKYDVKKIIVGYPRNMNGTLGQRAIKTDRFIEYLAAAAGDLEIIKWDERLSTVAANKILNETGVKSARKKKTIDLIAATYILQGYLDSMRNDSTRNKENGEMKYDNAKNASTSGEKE